MVHPWSIGDRGFSGAAQGVEGCKTGLSLSSLDVLPPPPGPPEDPCKKGRFTLACRHTKGRHRTGEAFHDEEFPLKDATFEDVIKNGKDLLERGRELLLEGTSGMAQSVPWLAPLPNSSDPNMFVFGANAPINSVPRGRTRWRSISPDQSDSESPTSEWGFQGHSIRR
jgi:hypothetical protein